MFSHQQPFDLDNFVNSYAACWEPTSQQLYPNPVGVQPNQRGWKEKRIRFLTWLINSSGIASLEENSVRQYMKTSWPASWLWGLAMAEQVLSKNR